MIHAHIGVEDLNFTTYNKYILTLISEVVSMRDESLNRFVSSMIDESLQEDVFVGYIEHFSKYLSYTNPDYQYNGTGFSGTQQQGKHCRYCRGAHDGYQRYLFCKRQCQKQTS